MHCYICDREDDGISFNRLHQNFDPCFTCVGIINSLTYNDNHDPEALEEDTDDHLYC